MTDTRTETFIQETSALLSELHASELRVQSADLQLVDDLTETPAWRVTLHLPSPTGQTWNVHELQTLMREARRTTDREATRHDVAVDGVTSVIVAAVNPPAVEIAAEDEPEPGEREDATRIAEGRS